MRPIGAGSQRPGSGRPPREREEQLGYTLVELALVIVLFTIVMTSIFLVLIGQRRFYASQSQIAGARDAARIAAEVLGGELRGASPAGGDLYGIAPDSLAFRSGIGFGVICDVSGNLVKLWQVAGTFADLQTDSALVFLEHGFESSLDDEWAAVRIERVKSRAPSPCPGGRPAQLELVLGGDLTGVTEGSPVRAFRPYVYKLYSGRGGRWWLGQRLRNGRLQPVAGPFAAPGSGGLRLEYLTEAGEPTNNASAVVQIRIALRTESARRIARADGADFYSDSVSTVVYLRNARATSY